MSELSDFTDQFPNATWFNKPHEYFAHEGRVVDSTRAKPRVVCAYRYLDAIVLTVRAVDSTTPTIMSAALYMQRAGILHYALGLPPQDDVLPEILDFVYLSEDDHG